MNDWQIWAALAAVVLATLFLVRKATAGSKTGCGGGCGCDHGRPHKHGPDQDSGSAS